MSSQKKYDRRATRYVLHYARSHGWLITFMTAVNCLTALVPVALAVVSKNLLEIATGDRDGSMLMNTVLLAALVLIQMALQLLFNSLSVRTAARIEMTVKRDMMAHLFRKKWRPLSVYHSGDILNRVTADVDFIVNGLTSIIPSSVSMFVRLASCLVVLYWLDWRVMLAVAGLGAVFVVVSRLYSIRMKALHKQAQETDGKTRAFFQECLENMAVIKAFQADKPLLQRLDGLQENNFRVRMKRVLMHNLSHGTFQLMFNSSYYIVLAWCAFGLTAQTVTVGTMTAFLQIINQIRMPLFSMSGLLPKLFSMLASAERMLELEDLPDEPITDRILPADWERISLREVDFAYDADHPVLRGFNGDLVRGQLVTVTGHSGIGKSTMIKLLLGLIEPDGGTLTVTEHGEETPLTVNMRGLFAYVPQDNMILSGTIRDNVAFGRDGLTDAQILDAMRIADIADLPDALPDGLDTLLGERGNGLSGGQIQRIAIARAIASGAPILLLDEATAALDEATEKRVLENIRHLSDRSCLIISHRPQAAAICDVEWRMPEIE